MIRACILLFACSGLGAVCAQDPALEDYAAGRYAAAAQAFATQTEQTPEKLDAHVGLALSLIRNGDLGPALQALDTALAIWPDEPVLHANRAVALLQSGRTDGVSATLRRALEGSATPGFELTAAQQADLEVRLAFRLAAAGDQAAAMTLLESANARTGGRHTADALRVLAANPDGEDLAGVLALAPQANPTSASLALARGYTLLGRQADATRVLSAAPQDPLTQAAKDALAARTPARTGETDFDLLVELTANAAAGRWDDVRGGAERLAQGGLYATEATLLHARADLMQGRARDAQTQAEGLLDTLPAGDPRRQDAVTLLAHALYQRENDRALVDLMNTEPAANRPVELRTMHAAALAQLGQMDEAQTVLAGALALLPDHAPALALKAQIDTAGQGTP